MEIGQKPCGTWCLVQMFLEYFLTERYSQHIDGCSLQLMMSYFDREQTEVVHIEKDGYYLFLGKAKN